MRRVATRAKPPQEVLRVKGVRGSGLKKLRVLYFIFWISDLVEGGRREVEGRVEDGRWEIGNSNFGFRILDLGRGWRVARGGWCKDS
jgi:hypothetical protein